MISMEYGKGGTVVSDFDVDDVYNSIKFMLDSDKPASYIFSNETIFNRVRLGIASGEIFHENVTFFYKGNPILINHYGAITNWPNGFCDANITLSEKIICNALKKRNERIS